MAEEKTDERKERGRGDHSVRLDGFTGKDDWIVRVDTFLWPKDRTIARISVFGFYGARRVLLRGPVEFRPGGVDKDGSTVEHATIGGTWPGTWLENVRTPLVADDIEAVLTMEEAAESTINVRAITRSEFNARFFGRK